MLIMTLPGRIILRRAELLAGRHLLTVIDDHVPYREIKVDFQLVLLLEQDIHIIQEMQEALPPVHDSHTTISWFIWCHQLLWLLYVACECRESAGCAFSE
jgi:hypothetical protein